MTTISFPNRAFVSVSLDYFGTLGVSGLENLIIASTKRERKVAFRQLCKLIQLARLIPAGSEILSISQGSDPLGEVRMVIVYALS